MDRHTRVSESRRNQKVPKSLIIAALAIVAGCLVIWRYHNVRKHFQETITVVHEGMTKDEVIKLLGKPYEARKPCTAPRPACDQDLIYALPFDFVSFWTVSFDHSGHVIHTFHWQSP